MKKVYLLFLLALLPFVVYADPVEINGIYYNLVSKARVAEITSTSGNFSDKVAIPETVMFEGKEYSVTSIGDQAFLGCSGVNSISIPNSVTSIGGGAFWGCSGLTSMTIPKNVTAIGNHAFSDCTGLTSVTIGNSVTSIGDWAFSGCRKLASVNIGNSVTSIGNYVFSGCRGLTSITIPNSVISIGEGAFQGCFGLTAVHISDLEAWCRINFSSGDSNPLLYAHHLIMDGKEIKDLEIPNNVNSIGNEAFTSCNGLSSVTIPNGVLSIGHGAFSGCSGLTLVIISNSVTSIGKGAFYGCSGLATVAIPNSVIEIGYNAFEGSSKLTTIQIGNGIKKICGSAFANCEELTDVYCYAENVPSTDSYAFDGSYIEYATLHVPNGCSAAYKAVAPWKNFKTVVEMVDAKVKLSKTKATIEKGKTLTLKATITPTELIDKSVKWKSSNKNVATVTSAGKVKGVGAGTATITCTSVSTGAKATCKVTVGYVELDKVEAILEKGKTMTLKATVYPSTLTDKTVTWESSNTRIATVTTAGKVKGVRAGTATITCTSNATGLKTTCTVNVVKGTVTLNKTEAFIEKGKTTTLKATLTPTTLEDKSVKWTSSDKTVATVSSSGKVKGVGYGTATITCTSVATGVSATCQVTIGKVVINMSDFSLKRTRTVTLKATLYPTTLTDKSVTWKSSDTKVATVTSSGKVKGVGAGTATITCTSVATGLKGTCTVTVLAASESRSIEGDDDEATGIDEVNIESTEVQPFDVYDLSGRKVAHQVTTLEGLPDGVYIVNGKKILKK